MSVLDTLDFQPMLIVDMFRPHKGKRLVAAHRQPGKTPFVGGSESYNSITGFSDVDPLFPGGWITLVYNGSVGQTRLQPAPFFASDDVIALEPIAKNVSEAALLVCCAIIQRECVNKYSYGSKLNLQRLNRQTVMVPTAVGSDGTIEADWDGMDRLGAELLDQVVTRTHSARETRLADDDTLPELRFEPMLIDELFIQHRGKQATRNDSGKTPYVVAASRHNSQVGFVDEQPLFPGNWLAMVNTGAGGVGYCTYQPVPFWGSNNVTALEPRYADASESALMFLAGCVRLQTFGKFSYGNIANMRRLGRTRIMVPVVTNAEGEDVVDWEGMSAYGHALRVRVERAITPVIGSLS